MSSKMTEEIGVNRHVLNLPTHKQSSTLVLKLFKHTELEIRFPATTYDPNTTFSYHMEGIQTFPFKNTAEEDITTGTIRIVDSFLLNGLMLQDGHATIVCFERRKDTKEELYRHTLHLSVEKDSPTP